MHPQFTFYRAASVACVGSAQYFSTRCKVPLRSVIIRIPFALPLARSDAKAMANPNEAERSTKIEDEVSKVSSGVQLQVHLNIPRLRVWYECTCDAAWDHSTARPTVRGPILPRVPQCAVASAPHMRDHGMDTIHTHTEMHARTH
jgi:hypothetical protein